MTIRLDITQRISLHGLLGGLRPSIGAIRQIWALQDRLRLSDEEERAVALQRAIVDTQERVTWDAAAAAKLEPVSFELSQLDVAYLRSALTEIPQPVNSRSWLEPLLAAGILDERP